MKVEDLKPLPKEKTSFKLSSFKLIPKQAACYIITNSEGDILYIGLSDNLFNRFLQHLGNPEKTNPTTFGKAIWFYYLVYDPINLPKLERTWLNQFAAIHGGLPVLNKVNSPIS